MPATGAILPKFLDLFAGCGGLSLGLEQAGFQPLFVNELNKDARESYLINRDEEHPYLRERFHIDDVKKLVLDSGLRTSLINDLKSNFSVSVVNGDLDLIVGGPPCQGFSGIGIRRSYSVEKQQLPSNHLYQDMAFLISQFQPKAFVFENVRGLLSARWTKDGPKGEIWNDVQNTFRSIEGYEVRSHLVYAKEYGVPQNRPRILMVGVRLDQLAKVHFQPSNLLRAGGLLPEPTAPSPNLVDVLGDLVDPKFEYGGATSSYPSEAKTWIQRYFRTDKTGQLLGKGAPLAEHEYSNHSPRIRQKFAAMIASGGEIPAEYATRKFSQKVLPKKWGNLGATITTTSLPDDYIHFEQARSMTVREWARLQTFPDWYKFSGKRTTGGIRRAGNPRIGIHDRELPKYTQIGNAVPVLLAQEVGKHLKNILDL